MKVSAIFLVFSTLEKTNTSAKTPARIKPNGPSGSAISPLPSVVPMLAPMITLIAGRSAITPALTSPTTITVIAVLDCSTPVISVPANKPFDRRAGDLGQHRPHAVDR